VGSAIEGADGADAAAAFDAGRPERGLADAVGGNHAEARHDDSAHGPSPPERGAPSARTAPDRVFRPGSRRSSGTPTTHGVVSPHTPRPLHSPERTGPHRETSCRQSRHDRIGHPSESVEQMIYLT